MRIDLFREARERVTAEEAARVYGLSLDRRGWALCPFHNDRKPSMSFHKGRFHCWACDKKGDSIDLVAELLGLDALGAVRRINEDFRLALPLDRKPTGEEQRAAQRRRELAEQHRAFEEWRGGFVSRLNAAYRVGHMALKGDTLTDREALAVRMMPTLEYWSDTLSNGTPTDQAQIYRERGAIAQCIDKILSSWQV